MDSVWDQFSENFVAHKRAGDIDAAVADNILLAWPALFKGIEAVQSSGRGRAALDYGCGAGSFAEALYRRGYKVQACDTSSGMIKTARSHLGRKIAFHVAGHDAVGSFDGVPFDLVASVQVFQFVKNIDKALHDLDAVLRSGGLFAFVAFNPDYVRANTGNGKPFILRATSTGQQLCLVKRGVKIPVFLRTEHEYHARLRKLGYTRVLVRRPRFTRAFLSRYPVSSNTRYSEFIVMVYRKN